MAAQAAAAAERQKRFNMLHGTFKRREEALNAELAQAAAAAEQLQEDLRAAQEACSAAQQVWWLHLQHVAGRKAAQPWPCVSGFACTGKVARSSWQQLLVGILVRGCMVWHGLHSCSGILVSLMHVSRVSLMQPCPLFMMAPWQPAGNNTIAGGASHPLACLQRQQLLECAYEVFRVLIGHPDR